MNSFMEYWFPIILRFNNLLWKWITQIQMEIWSRGRDEFDRFLDLHSAQLSDRIFQFMYFRHFSSQPQVLSFSEYLNAMPSVFASVLVAGREDKHTEIKMTVEGDLCKLRNPSRNLDQVSCEFWHYSFQEQIIETKNEINITWMNSLIR